MDKPLIIIELLGLAKMGQAFSAGPNLNFSPSPTLKIKCPYGPRRFQMGLAKTGGPNDDSY